MNPCIVCYSCTCTSFLVSFSSSLSLSLLGSTVTPPLAPPKGMSITAVFQVIRDARLFAGHGAFCIAAAATEAMEAAAGMRMCSRGVSAMSGARLCQAQAGEPTKGHCQVAAATAVKKSKKPCHERCKTGASIYCRSTFMRVDSIAVS